MKRILLLAALIAVPVTASAQVLAQGSINSTTVNPCVVANSLNQAAAVNIQITGTFSGTITFKGFSDVGRSFTAVTATNTSGFSTGTTTTSGGIFTITNTGYSQIEACMTSFLSGGAYVTIMRGYGAGGSGGGGGGGSAPSGTIGAAVPGTASPSAFSDVNGNLAYLALDSNGRVPISVGNGSATATVGGVADVALVWNQYPTLQKGITLFILNTTSTQVIPAVSSNYLYISGCRVSNTSGSVDTVVDLQDGSGGTVIDAIPAPHNTGGAVVVYTIPLKVPTNGNGLYTAPETTSASVKVSCNGFSSTTSY